MRIGAVVRARAVAALAGVLLLALPACSSASPARSAAPASPSPARPTPAGSGASAGRATAGPGVLSPWRPCGPTGAGFDCSTLTVPLSGDAAAGSVALAVSRHRASGPTGRRGVLAVNPGGPGASAVAFLQSAYLDLPATVRDHFDVVAFDPRGVGASAPIRCESTAELDRYFHLDPTPDNPKELAAYEAGNAALATACGRRSGRVLPHVSTAEAAADLDRLRAALGEQRISYLGYSYGTSIGAAYLDRFPTRVGAMVLDGAIDPALTWDQLLEGQSRGFDVALGAFLADCQARQCAFRKAVRGSLGAAYDALARRVETRPLPGAGARTVGPGEFSLGVGAGLYSRDAGWPAIADALASASRGEGSQLLALSDSYLERGPDGYANVSEANLAVNCIDRPWPRTTQPYLDLARKVAVASPRFGPAIALSGLACASWPVPAVDRPHRVRGQGAPPVIVIGTTRDPATPYAWARSLAGQLAGGVLLTHEGDGHTVYRVGAPTCITATVDAYLVQGKAPRPARC